MWYFGDPKGTRIIVTMTRPPDPPPTGISTAATPAPSRTMASRGLRTMRRRTASPLQRTRVRSSCRCATAVDSSAHISAHNSTDTSATRVFLPLFTPLCILLFTPASPLQKTHTRSSFMRETAVDSPHAYSHLFTPRAHLLFTTPLAPLSARARSSCK